MPPFCCWRLAMRNGDEGELKRGEPPVLGCSSVRSLTRGGSHHVRPWLAHGVQHPQYTNFYLHRPPRHSSLSHLQVEATAGMLAVLTCSARMAHSRRQEWAPFSSSSPTPPCTLPPPPFPTTGRARISGRSRAVRARRTNLFAKVLILLSLFALSKLAAAAADGAAVGEGATEQRGPCDCDPACKHCASRCYLERRERGP